MLLPFITPHVLLWDKESFVPRPKKNKKQNWVLHSEFKTMFSGPEIKEKLLEYISDTFSRVAAFLFSSRNMVHKWRKVMLVKPTWSELPHCKLAVGVGYPRRTRWQCQAASANQRASTSQAWEYSSCKVWVSLFAPASFPLSFFLATFAISDHRTAVTSLS